MRNFGSRESCCADAKSGISNSNREMVRLHIRYLMTFFPLMIKSPLPALLTRMP